MNNKIYKITLADGTVIENLKLNGNNFVSDREITSEMFGGNLSKVTIHDGEKDTVLKNMELVQIAKYGEEYFFILRQLTDKELQDIKNRADIDYIAMMTDVEI